MGKLSMIGQMKKEAERDFTKFVKYVAELEEENKKLKEKYERLEADYIKLSKIVEVGGGYRASYVNELRDKIAKLEQELKIWILTAKDYARLQGVDLEDSPRL